MNIRNFSIHALDGLEVQANLNPVSPYVHVIKDGMKVRSFLGKDEVAQFCQISLLSILEMMSGVQDELGASEAPEPETGGAKIIPFKPAERFSNIEF